MSKKIRPFPKKHLGYPDAKAWRQHKRQQWKQVVNALQDFEYGCAYTPVSRDVFDLKRLVDRMSEDMRGDWIAW